MRLKKGLRRGTIFQDLDKPFPWNRRLSKWQITDLCKAELLDWINTMSFVCDDTKLFLDTHPCNTEALEFLRGI